MKPAQIGKGGTQATWDIIYSSRQKILYAAKGKDVAPLWAKIRGAYTTNSDLILRHLIEHGRLPVYAVHNFNSVAPFRELYAHDNGNDIELSVRLPKGGDIKNVLTILGDRLRTYADAHPAGEINSIDLQQLLDCAHMEALAANRAQGGKQAPDLNRAIGLWLWDRSMTHPEENHEQSVDVLFESFPSLNGKVDDGHFYRLVNRTNACIVEGKTLPLTSK